MALAQVGGTLYSNTGLVGDKVAAFGGPCLVFNIVIFNPDATSTAYVQFFDAASSSVTVGSTAPTFVLPVGPKAGMVLALNCPRAFRTAVTIAATLTATGSGQPGTAVVISFDYVGG